jgi:hypothetical protein
MTTSELVPASASTADIVNAPTPMMLPITSPVAETRPTVDLSRPVPRRQSLPKLTFFLGSFSHQDPFISGAVLLGVEQHEVAAYGAFDPDGKGYIGIVVLPNGETVTVGEMPAFHQERGKASDAECVR